MDASRRGIGTRQALAPPLKFGGKQIKVEKEEEE
jgi:hypothetical protein